MIGDLVSLVRRVAAYPAVANLLQVALENPRAADMLVDRHDVQEGVKPRFLVLSSAGSGHLRAAQRPLDDYVGPQCQGMNDRSFHPTGRVGSGCI